MTNDNVTASAPAPKSVTLALLSDIRTVIAALLGIYGVLLLIAGLVPSFAEFGAREFEHTPDRVELAAGSAGNLWVGGALVLVAIAFEAWAVVGVKRAGS
ncbi:hypothetical protein [Tsukamurella paurometabola]|uniref:Uncharacterized protein n=1 Tax=Tsukamurella paurometabola TaxID=2061 RepID=A0A3P8K3B5_TSUPA|nr:hypothetical protein [Tsukamurella paurometabola]MBS4102073.1 hypothetical protein [Tsukamurella paurometabola]UEA82460.1 hypothetical protein LK411_19130 [Tsukamurella paurometabola]VDR39514.1 Uncharacterised protein [Tsukamurella paurometabola]